VHLGGAELFQADGQTDMTKLMVLFAIFRMILKTEKKIHVGGCVIVSRSTWILSKILRNSLNVIFKYFPTELKFRYLSSHVRWKKYTEAKSSELGRFNVKFRHRSRGGYGKRASTSNNNGIRT
jgi:hypothetical protein